MSKISFYTDISKQKAFEERLKAIILREDSSVKQCYLSLSLERRIVLFLESYKRGNLNSTSFDFSQSFLREDRDEGRCYDSEIRSGFTKEDLILLDELFSEFTIYNSFEAQFFASKFIEMNGYKNFSAYVFKFTEDNENGKFIIDNKKLVQFYECLKVDEVLEIINDKSEETNELKEASFYRMLNNNNKEKEIAKMLELNEKTEVNYVVVEFYKNFETKDRYIRNVIYQVGDETVTESFRDFKGTK